MKSESRFTFTKERLNAIQPPATGRATYYDTTEPGLLLRVGTTGVKSFEVRKKVSGRAVRATLGRYPSMTIDQARKQAAKQRVIMHEGVNPNTAKRANRVRGVTLQACLNDYLRVRAHKLAESTQKNYRSMIEVRLSDWLATPLKEIDRDMVAARHQRITKGDGTKESPASPVAANNVMRVLRALFNFANGQYEIEGKGLFPDNPVKRLSHTRVWTKETRRQTIIKTADMPKWFKALDTLRSATEQRADSCAALVADYLEFVLFTGLRRDDALCLRWDQVDFAAKTMHPVIHKKASVVMSFPLAEHVLKLLRRRHADRVNDFVFPGREPFDGAENSKRFDDPKRQIARMVEISGIKFSSHDLRRTFITVAESLDLSPFALKRLCSHSAGSDVTAGYVIMDVERLRAPTEKITDFLLKAAGRLPGAKVVKMKGKKQK